ncbi:PREDICTED: pituitary homeobox 3-like [Acropora digitifera]|uniref:pituitary homeobox 3-like n=1 Tax=Acropora digitifera TaxID=70779 RepID=UPI000779F2E2|nr:PREDICTED: pituitary homeobox 3-like [Acropora digitifera]
MKAKKDKSIQTLPWESHRKVISRGIPVSLTAPEHFSAEQINKLESRFSHQKWPDKTDIIIIGMESNLLAEEVEVWFQARRKTWLQGARIVIALAKESLSKQL